MIVVFKMYVSVPSMKLHYYSNIIHTFDWKSVVKHNDNV